MPAEKETLEEISPQGFFCGDTGCQTAVAAVRRGHDSGMSKDMEGGVLCADLAAIFVELPQYNKWFNRHNKEEKLNTTCCIFCLKVFLCRYIICAYLIPGT